MLITDFKYYRLFYPAETLVLPGQPDGAPSAAGPALPLLDGAKMTTTAAGVTADVSLDPSSDPFLVEHRLNGRAILPVVIGIELLSEAARLAAGNRSVVEIRDVEVTNSLKFHTDEPRIARVWAERAADGMIACRLTADVCTRDGQLVEVDRLCLSACVELAGDTGRSDERLPKRHFTAGPPAPTSGWETVVYPPADAPFYSGPPLRCLRKIAIDAGTAWGKIIAPALVELASSRRNVEGWVVPSALLDACLFATGLLAWRHVAPGTALPRGFGGLRLGRAPQPGEACLVWSKFKGREGKQASFDFRLSGCDGDVIFDVMDYRVVWLA